MKLAHLVPLCSLFMPLQPLAQLPANNSNSWPVFRDTEYRFRVSYPPNWLLMPLKGTNVRFSVSPPNGPGNCNVVARPNVDLKNLTQIELNREIEASPSDASSWASYIGIPKADVTVLESRRTRVHRAAALYALLETRLENLQGPYMRKQIVALTLTPGVVWTINCGVSTFSISDARSRFAELQTTFALVFGSFSFLE